MSNFCFLLLYCQAGYIGYSAPTEVLIFDDVIRSLLAEVSRKKSVDHGKQDAALNVDRGRRQFRGKSHDRGKSCSCKDIECHHCSMKGHIKCDYYESKRERREKKMDANKNEDGPKDTNRKGKVKIEVINVVTTDSDHEILFMSDRKSVV